MNSKNRIIVGSILCVTLILHQYDAYARDSTTFLPAAMEVKHTGMPVGSIIAWSSTSWPPDKNKWLECNGQSFSATLYPDLVIVLGKTATPDYRGQFLRGLQAGHRVEETVKDSLESHNHTQPVHTHSFSGQLASTAVSGTAEGQISMFSDIAPTTYALSDPALSGFSTEPFYTGMGPSHSHDVVVSGEAGSSSGSTGIASGEMRSLYETHYNQKGKSSFVSGKVNSGTVVGSNSMSGGDPTDYTGDRETAPKHIYTRYLIRASM